MGSGKRITANINNSDVNTVYSFSYNNPYYTVDGISRGFNLSFRETDATEANIASYTSDQYGVGVKYGFPLSEFNRASLGIAYENTSIHTSVLTPQSVLDFLSENSDEFNIYKLTLGWSHDTRNRTIFANDGLLVSLSNTISLPGSGLEYYKIDARVMKFQPITKTFTLLIRDPLAMETAILIPRACHFLSITMPVVVARCVVLRGIRLGLKKIMYLRVAH